MWSVDYGEKVKTQSGSGMVKESDGSRELAECFRGTVDFSNIRAAIIVCHERI